MTQQMNLVTNQAQWQQDTYTDDQGPHVRATACIDGIEVCVVRRAGSKHVTVFIQRPADQFPSIDIVPIVSLQEWLERKTQ
jgi:hypothetical protein